MEQTIELRALDGRSSKIYVGQMMDKLGDILPKQRVVIITDANLHRNYGEIIDRYEHIIIGMGESHKTLTTVTSIYNQMIEREVDRECFILGFGGGVVCDIAGFVASTYMRGLPFGFVATTLLAQVDASIGGKNGINVEGYKNIVGALNQPEFVLCDPSLLETLSPREMLSGFGEVIKAGLIADPALFSMFEQGSVEQIVKSPALLHQMIVASIRVKVDIVQRDERESSERRKLNLGHTFAHAIERSSTLFTHGEAVAIGIVMASDLAVRMQMLSPTEASHIRSVIANAGLPTESGVDIKRLLKAVLLDKKRQSESINIVLPTGIGRCEMVKITIEELKSHY